MASTKAAKGRSSWGTVRKQRSGLYQASYTGPDGQRHNAPFTYGTKTDARTWLSAQQTAISNGTWRSPQTLAAEQRAREAATFGRYAETWLTQRVNRDGKPLAPKTLEGYRRNLAIGLADFHVKALDNITPADVRTWHSKRINKGATQAGREARLLHAIMATALKDELITRNPVESSMTRSSSGKKRRPVTDTELAVILDTIGDRFYLAIVLSAFGGLRAGEWRALRRKDITVTTSDNGERKATVSVTRQAQHISGQGWIVGPPKSAEGVRTVTMPPDTVSDIVEHLSERTGQFPDSILFPAEGHSEFVHDRQFRDAWDIAKAAAGCGDDVTPHSLRHYAGTQYAATGAPLAEIKARLGHATFAAAMVYQHATDRDAEFASRLTVPKRTRSNVTQLPTNNTAAS